MKKHDEEGGSILRKVAILVATELADQGEDILVYHDQMESW